MCHYPFKCVLDQNRPNITALKGTETETQTTIEKKRTEQNTIEQKIIWQNKTGIEENRKNLQEITEQNSIEQNKTKQNIEQNKRKNKME